MSDCGKGTQHCCWFNGEVCQYLAPSSHPNFIWCCSLKRDLGSWEAVYNSYEYTTNVKPKYIEIGRPELDCGKYPLPGEKCNDCGQIGA